MTVIKLMVIKLMIELNVINGESIGHIMTYIIGTYNVTCHTLVL